MIIVADTGPLNYLVRMDRVGLLRELYQKVVLPQAVLDELSHIGAPAPVRAWASALPAWVDVQRVTGSAPSWMDLGAGETAAIVLAVSLRADLVLMDELAGRKAAQKMGLSVAGTMSVLGAAARFKLPES